VNKISNSKTVTSRADDQRQLLVSLEELSSLDPAPIWVDTRRGADYRRGHLPGAIHFDNFIHANEHTSRAELDALAASWMAMFAAAGIPLDAPVIFYDAGMENRAPRPAFMLRALGNSESRVLHGGIRAWREAGRPLSTTLNSRPPGFPRARPPRLDQRWVAGVDDVIDTLRDGSAQLLDVRDEPEYRGRRRLQWNPRLGRLPGAIPLEWTALLERDSSTAQGPLIGFKPDHELSQLVLGAGLSADLPVIVYCQKSHRACNTYLALERLGFHDVRVYVGSFREWSRRPELPIEREPREPLGHAVTPTSAQSKPHSANPQP